MTPGKAVQTRTTQAAVIMTRRCRVSQSRSRSWARWIDDMLWSLMLQEPIKVFLQLARTRISIGRRQGQTFGDNRLEGMGNRRAESSN